MSVSYELCNNHKDKLELLPNTIISSYEYWQTNETDKVKNPFIFVNLNEKSVGTNGYPVSYFKTYVYIFEKDKPKYIALLIKYKNLIVNGINKKYKSNIKDFDPKYEASATYSFYTDAVDGNGEKIGQAFEIIEEEWKSTCKSLNFKKDTCNVITRTRPDPANNTVIILKKPIIKIDFKPHIVDAVANAKNIDQTFLGVIHVVRLDGVKLYHQYVKDDKSKWKLYRSNIKDYITYGNASGVIDLSSTTQSNLGISLAHKNSYLLFEEKQLQNMNAYYSNMFNVDQQAAAQQPVEDEKDKKIRELEFAMSQLLRKQQGENDNAHEEYNDDY